MIGTMSLARRTALPLLNLVAAAGRSWSAAAAATRAHEASAGDPSSAPGDEDGADPADGDADPALAAGEETT